MWISRDLPYRYVPREGDIYCISSVNRNIWQRNITYYHGLIATAVCARRRAIIHVRTYIEVSTCTTYKFLSSQARAGARTYLLTWIYCLKMCCVFYCCETRGGDYPQNTYRWYGPASETLVSVSFPVPTYVDPPFRLFSQSSAHVFIFFAFLK